ncbi:hypothetical protein [Burkholderia multivorans]|uniref:hypothetical protein n=1 Tax=Burkholderia multivorans TaxID=87883 RepID=UPI000D00E279|nr:hypothetical protein [Burkholderia multivorans]PRE06866.1 hypothetical protein C6P91_05940 [Burkholderia multivorans]
MNNFMRIFIVLCFLIEFEAAIAQVPQAEGSPLLGEWRYVSAQHEGKKPYSTFVIQLHRSSGNQVAGAYCFITEEGQRVDCDPDGVSNLSGVISPDGSRATINFFSFFGAKDGVADVSLSNGELHWKVVKNPDGDFFYGPFDVFLVRNEKPSRNKSVVSNRAYLYNGPTSKSKSKAYLIKGDEVELLNISDNLKFWRIRYTTTDGRTIERWIECGTVNACP